MSHKDKNRHEISDGVEVLINILGDRVDLSVQFILNLEEIMLVVLSDEVDSESQVTETT